MKCSRSAITDKLQCAIKQHEGLINDQAGKQAGSSLGVDGRQRQTAAPSLLPAVPYECSAALLTTWPSSCTRVSGCLLSSFGRAARAAKLGWLAAMLLPAACGCAVDAAENVDATVASSKPLMPRYSLF